MSNMRHRIVVIGTYDKYMFNIGNQIVVRYFT